MNNFRRQPKQTKKQQGSVDGFLRGPSRPSGAGFEFNRHRSYQPDGDSRGGLERNKRYFSLDGQQQSPWTKHQSGDAPAVPDLSPPPQEAAPRKPQRRHHKIFAKLASKSFLAVLLIVIVMSGYLFGKGYLKARDIFQGGGSATALHENADPSQLNGEGDGRVNILLLGTGGEDHDNGSFLIDTIIVASIDPIHKEAALLSVPRDFYVKTDYWSMKINAVYKTALNDHLQNNPGDNSGAEKTGFRAMEKAVEESMGIPIHYYSMIDFDGFKKAIDTVGGITIDVENPVYEPNMRIDGRNYTLNVGEGRQSFDGFRALAYSRSRLTSARGDFDRSERQRNLLIALKDKIFSISTLSNPLKINQLLSDFGDNMRTNLSINEILRLQEIGSGIDASNIGSISLVDEPNVLLTGANLGGAVQVPKAGTFNYKEIHSFVRNKLRDGYLRSEEATIAVLNGTNIAGLARLTADDLESYGYNISQVDDSPIKDQSVTTVINLRGDEKKYTRAYLEKRFGVNVVNSLPDNRIVPGDADFVIILGQNEQARLNN